ncbi:hypothetical protein FRACYDRAFT_240916 [Fragilariopsis cylindrus CCMP1102]|uniref:Uncharacterized protein n=1 Tax=Fragilariopsis cylindrus CCMP1102 TaxID=635003 RepID=A0A1E7F888_9STRA|nr:hypothetical protein FRACYDRAFT_240916 [Fragilariopsis cylindrus CCMP1102]|eukprot:OEU14376.1 hypothetical protein FRACYDRAFT_240916 [Fragilariopsis cylindrus CCMP1102]
MNTPSSAAEIAIGNIRSLFECSVLISQQKMKPEEAVVIFDAFCDENISLELNGKRYRYDWLLFSARQNWAKQSTFENLETEVLDRITFHYTYDFHFHDDEDEDYLQAVSQPPSYKIHCMATVNPKNSKVIKIKVMTGEAAMHLVHFNRHNLKELDTSSNTIDVNNNSIHGHVATQNILRIRPVTGSEGCKDIEIVAMSKFTTSSNASVDVDRYKG